MEETTPIWKNAFTHGLILGLGLIVVTIMLYATDSLFNPSLAMIYYVVIAAIIAVSGVKQKKIDDGVLSYGKALGAGTVTAVAGSVVFAMFFYILYTYIDAGLIEKYFYAIEEGLIQQGYSDKEIETSMAAMKMVSSPALLAIGSFFSYSIIGFILSLVTSIFVKSKNQNIA